MSFLISIVVPCYNQAQYLEECIQSVFNQTYQNWECIIVNDGSPDNTGEVALSLCAKDSRIRYLKKENGGLSSARNAGIQIAEGEFILPLDADDKIGDVYLEKSIEAFSHDSEINLVYCAAKKFGTQNQLWDLSDYSYKELLINNMIFCSAVYRKSDWEIVGGYDENLKSGFEDWAFWLKILHEESIVFKIPEVLFFYRIKEVSMLKDLYSTGYDLFHWYLFEKNLEKYKKHYPSPISTYIKNDYQSSLLQSSSFKIGNRIVRFLKFFSFQKG